MIYELSAYELILLSGLSLVTAILAYMKRHFKDFLPLSLGFLILAFSKVCVIFSHRVMALYYITSTGGTFLIGYSLVKFSRYLRSFKELEKIAFYDPLTGAYNRKFIEEYINEELKKARRLKGEFSILLIDLNDFKQVNDKYGHSEGDKILKMVVEKLKSNLRDYDLIARWGGDEFLVVLPAEKSSEVLEVVGRLVSNFVIRYKDTEVTLSVGYARYPLDGDNLDKLLKVADDRMYRSKILFKEAKRHAVDDKGKEKI